MAFIIFNRARVGWPLLALASVFVGAAIAGMHYTGMAGMRMSGQVIYNPLLVGVSVGVGIILSLAALALTRNLIEAGSKPGTWTKKAGASLLFALAVAGMHYTGMAAATFTAGPGNWRPDHDLVLGTYEKPATLKALTDCP